MRAPHRRTSPWQIAIAASLFLALTQAGMFVGQAQTQQGEPKAKTLAVKAVEKPVPITDPTPLAQNDDYVLGPQDVIAINVWRDPELSRIEPVRPDGKISLPLVGDMKASGLTLKMLQTQITKALEDYVRKPEVTVILQEANSHRFNLLGEVARPGSYLLATNMTVLDALAAAGGFRDFAKVTRIYVLRKMPNGSSERIPFNYKQAIKGSRDMNLQLLPGDTIVVP
jgi:polysaccharide biosynthesis/export protein